MLEIESPQTEENVLWDNALGRSAKRHTKGRSGQATGQKQRHARKQQYLQELLQGDPT